MELLYFSRPSKLEMIIDSLSNCKSSFSKNAHLAYATLLLNYAVLSIESKDEQNQAQILSAALEIAEDDTQDFDSKYRALVAIGSLMLKGLVKSLALKISEIGGGKTSGKVVVRDVSAGEMKEFTVYLDVPAAEGQQDGTGTDGNSVMELLKVGGVYKQSWDKDKKKLPLGESIVTVVRTDGSSPASRGSDKNKELDLIEERVAYWCKVKLDLSAMYVKAESEAGVNPAPSSSGDVTEALALQEASVDAINRAMYHDIYNVVLLALKLRRGGDSGNGGSSAMENSPPTPLHPAKTPV